MNYKENLKREVSAQLINAYRQIMHLEKQNQTLEESMKQFGQELQQTQIQLEFMKQAKRELSKVVRKLEQLDNQTIYLQGFNLSQDQFFENQKETCVGATQNNTLEFPNIEIPQLSELHKYCDDLTEQSIGLFFSELKQFNQTHTLDSYKCRVLQQLEKDSLQQYMDKTQSIRMKKYQ